MGMCVNEPVIRCTFPISYHYEKSNLQFERVFDAREFCIEFFVDLQTFLYLRTTVDNGTMVATANELTNSAGGHLGEFVRQIHAHLTGDYDVVFPRTGIDGGCGDVEKAANLFEYIVDG